MGGPKDELRVEGRPVLSAILERLKWRGPTLLVAPFGGRMPPGHDRFDRVTSDGAAGEGPLRGILSAIRVAAEVVCVPVDMPGLMPEQVSWIAGELERRHGAAGLLLTRRIEGKETVEPFPCAFRALADGALVRRLASGVRAVHRLAGEPGVEVVASPREWGAYVWRNVNEPGELPAGWTMPGARTP